MNRKVLLFSILLGLVGGWIILLLFHKDQWLTSWTIGVILGIYPFAFWQIVTSLLVRQSTKLWRYILTFLIILKFIIIGAIIMVIGELDFIIATPLLIGFMVMIPVVLIIFLISARK